MEEKKVYLSPSVIHKSVETENDFADSIQVTVGTNTDPINEDWGNDDTPINGSIDL